MGRFKQPGQVSRTCLNCSKSVLALLGATPTLIPPKQHALCFISVIRVKIVVCSIISLLVPAAVIHAQSGTQVPGWAIDATWYQIFPERFRNSHQANDPIRESLDFPIKPSKNWRISPWTGDWYSRDSWEKELGRDFYEHGVFDRRYGGDLGGVIEKLDYLQELGITAIYFNPIFYARSLHKYDASSYHHIDPYFGPDPQGDIASMEKETADPSTWTWTAADKQFLELLQQARTRGIRVIIDGVFNHTGRDFFAFKDLRRTQEQSPYKAWYIVETFDDPQTKRNEFAYKGWWGHASLPEFADVGNTLHAGPREYIFHITRRWMDPNRDGDPTDGISGWRLDVAEEVPMGFWKEWNALVREINPEAFTVAEAWGDAKHFVKESGFSATMNYHAFAVPVKGFLIDNSIAASEFARLLNDRRTTYSPDFASVLQNLVDSHDTDRVASMIVNRSSSYVIADRFDYDEGSKVSVRANAKYKIRKPSDDERRIQKLVGLFQATYVGAPMIYYGTEAGMWGADDPDDRMPMVWPDLQFEPQALDPKGLPREPDAVAFDSGLFNFYKSALNLRRDHEVLRRGEFEVLGAFDAAKTFAFVRSIRDQQLIVVLNRSEKPQRVSVELTPDRAKLFENPRVLLVTAEQDGVRASVSLHRLQLDLPALAGIVIAPAPP
jgi:cyclomaltodextrinase / maltogenic alpha-amylase / neopullulanase